MGRPSLSHLEHGMELRARPGARTSQCVRVEPDPNVSRITGSCGIWTVGLRVLGGGAEAPPAQPVASGETGVGTVRSFAIRGVGTVTRSVVAY